MSHTILIVEDNTNIRRFLRTTLEIEGYRTLEASSVQESLERIDQERPDLVLLDLALPDGSGWDFMAAARSHADAETGGPSASLRAGPSASLRARPERSEGAGPSASLRASLPIVVLTASADPGMSERALAAGAAAFLTKPISAAELMANVRRVLEARS